MVPDDFTVSTLKEILRTLGLPTQGTKAELINRLNSHGSSGKWMTTLDPEAETEDEAGPSSPPSQQREASLSRKEIELFRKEKELFEREIRLLCDAKTKSSEARLIFIVRDLTLI